MQFHHMIYYSFTHVLSIIKHVDSSLKTIQTLVFLNLLMPEIALLGFNLVSIKGH